MNEAKVDTNASFVLFVYPFLFDGTNLKAIEDAVKKANWSTGEKTLPLWEAAKFPEDDLLAHVKNYLNPPEGKEPTALLWRMKDGAFKSPNCFGAQAEWAMVVSGKREVAFQFEGVQMALFRIGVGFLTVEASPKCDAVEDWLDFLHYFRFAGGQRGVKIKAQRRTQEDQHEPYFPPLAGGTEKRNGEGTLLEILDALLETTVRVGEGKDRWSEVFIPHQLVPFASLYLDGEMSDKDIATYLYRVRNFFPAQREIVPSPEDLRLDHPSLLSYADKMWFVFSQEGGAFVAFNAPQTDQTDFFRRQLPNHLREQYFLLFLLTLHQKFALMRLSQDVSEHWLKGDFKERTQSFERIRNDLLDFTARGYFVQVMQREHHHRVYRKWQEVFQLEQLYREVSDEVREMHEYLLSEQTKRLEEQTKRLEWRINALTTVIAVPALVMSFLSINLFGITAKEEGLNVWVALAIVALGLVVGLGFLKWLER